MPFRGRRRLWASALAIVVALATGLLAPGTAAAATGRGYAVSTAKLSDGRRVVLRWNPCQVITYRVNVSAVPLRRRPAMLAQVRAAVTRLGTASGLRFSFVGTTRTVPRSTTIAGQDAELMIAVTTPSSTDFTIGKGVLGYGGYRYWQWTTTTPSGRRVGGAAIARGWVVLDSAGLGSMRPGFGPGATQGNVILHELAHAIGLDHVDDRRQLLYPTLLPTAPDGYARGDRAGLRVVGRAAGCLSVPSSVVRDLR
ncbi:MAG: matrixin family metalloprotease [Kineosporiaceae bacterium]|nr:matrixin family metalloprotease [Kineosporiaceae bacterium]